MADGIAFFSVEMLLRAVADADGLATGAGSGLFPVSFPAHPARHRAATSKAPMVARHLLVSELSLISAKHPLVSTYVMLWHSPSSRILRR